MSRDRIIQLQERAEELGFSTIQDALDAGYHEGQDLVAGTFKLEKIDNMVEQEKAHIEWTKEKDRIVDDLIELRQDFTAVQYQDQVNTIDRAISFIKEVKSE